MPGRSFPSRRAARTVVAWPDARPGMTDSRTVIERYVAAIQAQDLDAVRDCFAEDATWWLGGELALSGTWRGRDAILGDFFGSIPRLYDTESISVEITGMVGGGRSRRAGVDIAVPAHHRRRAVREPVRGRVHVARRPHRRGAGVHGHAVRGGRSSPPSADHARSARLAASASGSRPRGARTGRPPPRPPSAAAGRACRPAARAPRSTISAPPSSRGSTQWANATRTVPGSSQPANASAPSSARVVAGERPDPPAQPADERVLGLLEHA